LTTQQTSLKGAERKDEVRMTVLSNSFALTMWVVIMGIGTGLGFVCSLPSEEEGGPFNVKRCVVHTLVGAVIAALMGALIIQMVAKVWHGQYTMLWWILGIAAATLAIAKVRNKRISEIGGAISLTSFATAILVVGLVIAGAGLKSCAEFVLYQTNPCGCTDHEGCPHREKD